MAKGQIRALSGNGELTSSCSMEQVARFGTWDAIVAGGGIAGSNIARRLAGRGHSVLLVERKHFPRYKVCGACLNLRCLHYLEEAGLTAHLSNLGATELRGIALHAGRRSAKLPLPGGMAVSRNALDVTLAQAAKDAGATLLFGTQLRLAAGTDGGRMVVLDNGSESMEVRGCLIIAADGLAGKIAGDAGASPRIARRGYLGLGALAKVAGEDSEAGQIGMHCARHGYVGTVRVEDGMLALAAAVRPASLRESGGIAACVADIFRESGQPVPVDLDSLDWKGTPVLTRRVPRISSERLVVLGDATGYVEPFTGEGMAWAMEGAAILDSHLHDMAPTQWGEGADTWEQAYRKAMFGRRLRCRTLSTALRVPGLPTAAISILSRIPKLSSPIVSGLNAVMRS